MDIRSYLKVNQRVHIELIDREGDLQRYPSRVENIQEDRIFLASPLKDRNPVFIPSGEHVTVIFTNELSVYSFRSRVIRSITDRIPLLVIETPETIEKAQKREYVRVPISLQAVISYQDQEGQPVELKCKTRDLSGGGTMLIINKHVDNISKGAQVVINLHLEKGEEPVSVGGEVLRTFKEHLGERGAKRQIIVVRFDDIADKVRQAIIKCVYKRQIELRRKGLL